jgi:type VII secretion-associated serine protease mycosin
LWDLGKLPGDATGAGIKVAVLDSGVDIQHPQLNNGKVADHLDLLRHLPTSEDLCGHGTAVAGVIAARRINGSPFRGIAPDALILSARVSEQVAGNEDAKPVSDTEMASAVRWAVSKGAKVINISFAYASDAGIPAFKAAVQEAISQNVVVVAAVGNNNTPEKHNPTPYPAAWPGVVGVAAMGPDGLRMPASGDGTYVDIAAPGVHVTVPRPGSGYAYEDGTSFAAPMVAATAALIFSRYPKLTGREVVQRLLATADPAPGGRHSTGYGVGVVNPVRAVTEPIDGLQPVEGVALPGAEPGPGRRQCRGTGGSLARESFLARRDGRDRRARGRRPHACLAGRRPPPLAPRRPLNSPEAKRFAKDKSGSPAALSLQIFGGPVLAAKIRWDGAALKGDPPARSL